MRLIHTADWHLGDQLGHIDRTADIRAAVERVAQYCERERADVLLVAGDLFSEQSRMDGLRDSIGHLQQVFGPFLARGGTILALTGNHDNEVFCQALYHAMSLAAPLGPPAGGTIPRGRLFLAVEPALVRLADPAGQEVQFILMPYPTPSRYLRDEAGQTYRNRQECNRNLQEAFVRLLRELHQGPSFDPSLPAVLAAHVHVQSAVLPRLFRVTEEESIVCADSDLPGGFAYVALGHIHRPQYLGGRRHVRYSGSIERLDLGEREDDKSVTLVDIGAAGCGGEPVCLPLEATPFHDIYIGEPAVDLPRLRDLYPDAARALVRCQISYRAGTDHLNGILSEVDQVFPRWYDRTWREVGTIDPEPAGPEAAAEAPGFADIVLDYLKGQLEGHADAGEVLQLAESLLAEEPR